MHPLTPPTFVNPSHLRSFPEIISWFIFHLRPFPFHSLPTIAHFIAIPPLPISSPSHHCPFHRHPTFVRFQRLYPGLYSTFVHFRGLYPGSSPTLINISIFCTENLHISKFFRTFAPIFENPIPFPSLILITPKMGQIKRGLRENTMIPRLC